MSEILRYVVVDSCGNEEDWERETLQDAIEAGSGDFAVIERVYTYDDSSLVWTSDGSNTWPPDDD